MSSFGQITGRLGQDPTLNYTNGGTPVVNLSVASNRQKKDANGEKINVADWYRVSVFGRDAEIIAQYARKGSALAFNGRLQNEKYVDREGVERTMTILVASSFEFVPTSRREEDGAGEGGVTKARGKPVPEDTDESDIPF